jgi:hypothetical protein
MGIDAELVAVHCVSSRSIEVTRDSNELSAAIWRRPTIVRSLLQFRADEDTCNVYGTRSNGLFRFEHDEMRLESQEQRRHQRIDTTGILHTCVMGPASITAVHLAASDVVAQRELGRMRTQVDLSGQVGHVWRRRW